MNRFLQVWRGAVSLLSVVILAGTTVTLAQPKYRTFNQVDLGAKKGHPGKSLGSQVCFTFINNEGFNRYGLHAIIGATILGIVDSGGFQSVHISGSKRIVDFQGDTIPPGGSATFCLLVKAKKPGTQADYWWWTNSLGDRASSTYLKLDPSADVQLYTQPNGGNAFDFLYRKVIQRPAGVVMGIARPDSAKYYGWVRYKTPDRKFFPDAGPARCFDYIVAGNGNQKPFVKELKNPHVKKYDNHMLGEAHALKLAVIANDASVTEPVDPSATRLGDLIYNDGGNPSDPSNGMSIRQLLLRTDSLLTFCGLYGPDDYTSLDSTLTKINRAFDGAYYAESFNPFLLAGTHSLGDVPWLLPNPSASPVGLTRFSGSILDDVPITFELRQNYPNPFNPKTTIEFNLGDDPAIVTLKIYNMLGQEVATLLNEEEMDGGEQSVDFDATQLSSGIYLYRIVAHGIGDDTRFYQESRKMMLMR